MIYFICIRLKTFFKFEVQFFINHMNYSRFSVIMQGHNIFCNKKIKAQ